MAKTLNAPAKNNGSAAPAVAAVSFLEATEEVVEEWGHASHQMLAAAPVVVSEIKVPTQGYFRSLLLRIRVIGGTSAGAVTLAGDAPYNILSTFAIQAPTGKVGVGPVNGWQLHTANKWAPTTAWMTDLSESPAADVTADADGNFTVMYRIPCELGGRDPLGANSNQQNDSRYKVSLMLAPASVVYTAAPDDALPTYEVEWIYEAYAVVGTSTPGGAGVQVVPDHHGTVQRIRVATPSVAAGGKKITVDEVGNLIRFIILIVRAANGARSDAHFPDHYRFTRDTNTKDIAPSWLVKHYMWERTGMTPDVGVYVIFDGEHDLDGRTGQGMRLQWMKTSSSTRLEIEGDWKAGIGSTLEVLVVDVVPAPGLVQA